MDTAVLFPGMSPVRFDDVARFMMVHPAVRPLLTEADERLGYSVVDRLETAQGDYSEVAQVAFMVNCLALAGWARDELGVEAVAAVGPSFGAKPLAAFSGALPFSDAVWMVAALARSMEEFFATECLDIVTHSFVRVTEDRLAEIRAELDARGEWNDVACYVDRDLYMLSLREHNIEWLDRRIRSVGGMSLYTMRPPLHSTAFAGLRERVEETVLGPLAFADPALPVVSDHDGAVLRRGEEIRELLLDGIVRPVRWPMAVGALSALGVQRVCVCGPDSLFGRVAATREHFEVLRADVRSAMQRRTATRPEDI